MPPSISFQSSMRFLVMGLHLHKLFYLSNLSAVKFMNRTLIMYENSLKYYLFSKILQKTKNNFKVTLINIFLTLSSIRKAFFSDEYASWICPCSFRRIRSLEKASSNFLLLYGENIELFDTRAKQAIIMHLQGTQCFPSILSPYLWSVRLC